MMAQSDKANLIVQKYIRRQYPELKECSLKKRPAFAGPSQREETMKKFIAKLLTTQIVI